MSTTEKVVPDQRRHSHGTRTADCCPNPSRPLHEAADVSDPLLPLDAPCGEPWNAMIKGDGRRRLCARCDRHVVDVAALPRDTVAALHAAAQAGQDVPCVRVTRFGSGAAPPRCATRGTGAGVAAVSSFLTNGRIDCRRSPSDRTRGEFRSCCPPGALAPVPVGPNQPGEARPMSILEVRKNLRKTLGPRTAYFRPWVRRLERKERPLFFRLARNIRRRSLPKIQAPLRHGFVSIDDAIADREMVRDHVRAAPFAGVRRETRLQEVIDIVHACSANYDVYIGRTYVRPGQEHRGPAARWRDHKTNPKRKARFARVLFRCDRDDIGRNEALAVALIKTWDAHGALCCNNSALPGARQKLSRDRVQLIYLCLTPKRAPRRRSKTSRRHR